ncbi:hypothetical protein F4604DRAFT_1687212 [Suillus subluteus]|nr:hypothetical protein F4604DRAFT_1687212 [Suillus subluteus]
MHDTGASAVTSQDNANMTVACQYTINQKPLLDTFLLIHATLKLSVQEVMFDVGTVSKVKTYQVSVNDLVHTLSTNNWKHVVFGISNHTNNMHGDLFVGYDKNKYVATQVDNFLAIILVSWQVLIDHVAESFLWFFSCGALVNNAESFSKLRVSVTHHGLSAAVTFNAVWFQPNFAAHLLLAFSDLVLIQCLSMCDTFPDMLGQSYMLSHHSDVFLLLCPLGDFLPLQCPEYGLVDAWSSANHTKIYVFEYWTHSFKAILAIKQYYAHEAEAEESDEKEATKEREISAHPKEASFYKKKLTDWDVAQKLFKQEIYEFDKAEQARKGDKDPIKFWTRHAREWFNKMSPAQKKQVEYVQEKWNKEGAPEESQVIYHKNNLKKVLEEFSEQLRRSMGCHVVMFVSHKKRVDQTLNVTLCIFRHESVPQNVKKSFSVSSDSIKEWTSNGFEFFGEWAKTEFYPTATSGDEEEDEHGLPTVIFDEEGYAQLPSQEGVTLKNQQELVRMIFHAAYKVFMGSHKLVPWRTITPCPSEYLEAGSVPDDLVICDPSHMRAKDINTIWYYWERHSMAQKRLVTFIKARSCDMRINVVISANVKASSKKNKLYIEVGSEADEQHSSAGLDTTLAVSSPAEVPRGYRFEFLDALSSDRSYLELVDAVKDLATITENLVNLSSKESYLPASEHIYLDSVIGSLDLLTEAPIQSAYSAAIVVLGLRLLLRDCKHVMEYEEDEAHPDALYYLPISVLDLQIILKVDSAISHVAGTVVGLIELAMRAGLPDDSDQEEKIQGANGEKDQEDDQEVVMGDVDVQMQEVEKDHEQEGKQKGKKMTRSQTSQVKTKKARTEDEPMRWSTRTRQPSKKNMRP